MRLILSISFLFLGSLPLNVQAFMPNMELGTVISQKVILNAIYLPNPTVIREWRSEITTAAGASHSLAIPSSPIYTEPRIQGIKRVVAEFTGGIHPMSLNADTVSVRGCTASGAISWAPGQVNFSLSNINQVKIDFNAAPPDLSQIKITLNGLRDLAGRLIAPTSRVAYQVMGDVNGDRVTDSGDYSYIYGYSLQCSVIPQLCSPIAQTNATLLRNDITSDFVFSGFDVGIVNNIVQAGQGIGTGHDARNFNCY